MVAEFASSCRLQEVLVSASKSRTLRSSARPGWRNQLLTHQEMIGLQAEKHVLIDASHFGSVQDYVLHLIHSAAYVGAARLAVGKSVLDVGCNTGYGSSILSNSADAVIGVDVSSRAIKFAQEKYSDRRSLKFQEVDGNRLPFADDSFDLITGFQLIEHLIEYDSFISELQRVLKPDGLVIFTTPNALLRLDPGMKPWNEFHAREFSGNELAGILSRYFGHVEVLALQAPEALYAVEAERVDKARRVARIRNSKGTVNNVGGSLRLLRLSVRSRVKGVLPQFAVRGLRRLKDTLRRVPNLREIQENYDVGSLSYRSSDLDNALDLMAVCSASDVRSAVDTLLRVG